MKFETFKSNLTKAYDELNETSLIKIEVPNDEEMLKIFLAKIVFTEHEIKMSKTERKR